MPFRSVFLVFIAACAPDSGGRSALVEPAEPAIDAAVAKPAPSRVLSAPPPLPSGVFTLGSELAPHPDPVATARARVSPIRARSYPYSAIGLVLPTYCTITLIGPHTALTAAHCVWDRRSGALIPITAIYFGASGDLSASAYVVPYPEPRFAISDAYTNPTEPNPADYDFAFLDFAPRDSPGAVVGWFGTRASHDGAIYLAGYPADETPGSLWERGPGTAGAMFGGSLPDVFIHDLEVTPGDSGACVAAWIPVDGDLGSWVCTGVQTARVIPSGPNLARAWDTSMATRCASFGDWP